MKLEQTIRTIRRNKDRSGAVADVCGAAAVACGLLWLGFANAGFGSAGAVLSAIGAAASIIGCYWYAMDEVYWERREAETLAQYNNRES